MSCRVVGRSIEAEKLDEFVRELSAAGVFRLGVRFIATAKNATARALVERLLDGRLIAADASEAQSCEFDIVHISPVTRPAYAELLTR